MALDLARHNFWVYVSLGGVIGEKIENLALKSDYEAVLDLKLVCFKNYGPSDLLTMIYHYLLPNWYF